MTVAFEKFPWLWSLAYRGNEITMNGFTLAELRKVRALVNWPADEATFATGLQTLEAHGVLSEGCVIWRGWAMEAAGR